MGKFLQIVCIGAIAVGAGFFAGGSYLEPTLNFANPAEFAQAFNNHQNSELRVIAAVLRGFGVGFMVLGTLMLVVPWLNAYVAHSTKSDGPPPMPPK
jgi:hypothetical protein